MSYNLPDFLTNCYNCPSKFLSQNKFLSPFYCLGFSLCLVNAVCLFILPFNIISLIIFVSYLLSILIFLVLIQHNYRGFQLLKTSFSQSQMYDPSLVNFSMKTFCSRRQLELAAIEYNFHQDYEQHLEKAKQSNSLSLLRSQPADTVGLTLIITFLVCQTAFFCLTAIKLIVSGNF